MPADLTISEQEAPYVAQFERSNHGTGRLRELRETAIDRFAELGFPTTRDEDWKFTNIAPLTRMKFDLAETADGSGLLAQLPPDEHRIVFVNGSHVPALSNGAGSLRQAPQALIERHLARYANYRKHAFVALNTAFLDDGAFLHVPNGTALAKPIHLIHISIPGNRPAVAHVRNLVVIGAGCQASVIETYLGEGVYFTNAVTEIVVGENSVVEHCKFQEESATAFHISTLQVEQSRSSVFASRSIAFGAALARTEINAVLDEGSECTLNGLYIGDGRRHIDTRTSIDHAKPHAASHELYKGILDGHSSAVFNGKIIVRKDAQKTDAKQTNKNLLLSEDATINTKPQLEILADDVRCTHGATIGQLDPESIFYLRSRGIDAVAARGMLTEAFAREVIDGIKSEPFREYVGRDCMLTATKGIDVAAVRADFPVLDQQVHGHPLVFLDNAASSQKPRPVIDAMSHLYLHDYANIHRGVHTLSERSTKLYEDGRIKIQKFLGAADSKEIIFVRGTTEGINLVAQTYGRQNVKAGDEILITALEHHSNIVPWQMLCEEKGATLKVVPVDDAGEIHLDDVARLINDRTRLIAIAHISNVLGTVLPVREIVELAHRRNIPVLVDGAQAVPHMQVDVQELGCDFYVFSSHKLYGPTGAGVLYGKAALLNAMPPWQGGGDMISSVTFEKTTYNTLPYKFEAGTPDIAGVIGLAAAVDYVTEIGLENIAAAESELLDYATAALSKVDGLRIIGTAKNKAAVISFVLEGIHPHDVGTILDQLGIAVRTGHHCAQPLMDRFCVPATTRASFAFYNTRGDVDALVRGIARVQEIFA